MKIHIRRSQNKQQLWEEGVISNAGSSKNVDTDSPKIRHGKLEFNLENGFLENGVGNRKR